MNEIQQENKQQKMGFIKQYIVQGKLNQLIIYIATGVCVTIFTMLALFCLAGLLQGVGTFVDYLIFAILSGTGIYGWYEFFRLRRIYKIDTIFPDFVRDLAESRRAGMTFTKAILFASKGNYGILTPEIEKISQQVSWGTSVNDALVDFSKRVNTTSIRRTISLIIEAGKSGGNVADVLDVAAKDAREIKNLEAERRTNMSSYVVVVYVGMFVFLAIVAILCAQFIPAMIGEGSEGMAAAVGGRVSVDAIEISQMFFWATLIQGLGSGLVAGVFEDGHLTTGVKHIFVMVLVTWFMFRVMIGI
jgi:flagellar protein FlaJ